jgi:two-component system OmpR family response regulator
MRVLLVEDEESMAGSLRRGLEAEGYIVEHARDGEDGLWMATEFEFDAIVLDIMIPKLNGFAVTRKLREAGRDVPILMLTAKVGELDQTEALDSGADDFLSKPFSYPVLLARLRALIRRGSTATTAVISLGDLRVDFAQRQCWRGDTALVLTPKEFHLLAYMAMHSGTVLTKATLLQHVWHEGPDMDTNVVEVYIGYLRKKIDLPFDRHSIETIRGHGYRIDPDGR